MTRIILTRFLAIFSKMLGPFIWHSDLFKIKPKTQAPVSVTCLKIHVSAACGKRLVMMFLYKKIDKHRPSIINRSHSFPSLTILLAIYSN